MSDSFFYYSSKLAWAVISPDSLFVLSIIGSLILLLMGFVRSSAVLLMVISMAGLVIAIFPVGEWVLYPLESRYEANPVLPDEVVGIIVLGGAGDQRRSSQWGQVEFERAVERYIAFIALAKVYPDARLVFTGGAGAIAQQAFKEAVLARRFFEEQGLDLKRIVFEGQSRSTYENAILSKELVNPGAGENWVLVTSASHMPRAMGVFCKVEWPVIPYPVDHISNPDYLWRAEPEFAEHLLNLKLGIKEWVGFVGYFVAGKVGGC